MNRLVEGSSAAFVSDLRKGDGERLNALVYSFSSSLFRSLRGFFSRRCIVGSSAVLMGR